MLKVGERAPDFTLPATQVGQVSLSDYRGRGAVVIIFYPKDNTPGCNRQLSAARDAAQEFARRGASVLAINPGSLASHQRWAEKFWFDFPIASDPDRSVCQAYGVLKDDGRGVQRTVYIVDSDGVVRYARSGMPPTEELLAALDAMAAR